MNDIDVPGAKPSEIFAVCLRGLLGWVIFAGVISAVLWIAGVW